MGQKNGLFLGVDKFATVSGRKACDMSVQLFVIVGRGPAYSGPQRLDLVVDQCTSRWRGGELVGVC